MQLSVFEMIKHGVSTSIDIVDSFARSKIDELNTILSAKQNITDNALTTSAKTIVGAINEINSDLSHTYFQLTSGGSPITIEQQDCWCQGNRVHIAFSATSNIVMPKDNVWGVVPNEYRGMGARTCGYVHIDNNPDIYINSIMIEGAESGYIYQSWSSSIPANTRVTFIGDYFI